MSRALLLHLQKAGRVTGPLSSNTSHSSLENIKKLLLGQKLFEGGEQYLHFGNHLHLRFLKPNEKPTMSAKLSPQELVRVEEMVETLTKDKAVKILMQEAVCEEKFYVEVDGVQMAMILDIKQPKHKRGADLKTTVCRSLADFIDKAKKYGYFRQAVTYVKGAKLKEFFFVGITKEKPYIVFLMNATDHKKELEYAEQELKFLLYFFKHYGKINQVGDAAVQKTAATRKGSKK